jgi:hypothetical protein
VTQYSQAGLPHTCTVYICWVGTSSM